MKKLASDKELYSNLCNLVNGALRACENDHGQIAIGSASKRVVGQLLGALQEGTLPLKLARELAAANAKIDALMLEYCPDEITGDQIEEWGKHQMPALGQTPDLAENE